MTKRKYKNYHKNPRIITDDQRTQLKKWIVEFGDLSGIVVNNTTGEKICGNQRGDAVNLDECEIEIVKKYEEPNNVGTVAEGFVLFDGVKLSYREVEWDEKRAEQANVIANKAGGTWDWQILTEDFEIGDLLEWGFTEDEFAGKDVEVEPEETVGDDDVPEVQEQAETVRGDLWELGNHRLLCGDSTLIDDVEKLMNGCYPDLIQTDPPYGMNAVSKSGVLSEKYKKDILGDDSPDIAKESFVLIYSMFPNSKQVWWGANYYCSVLPDSECWLVWDKNNGESDQTDCELAWANFRSVVRQFTQVSEKTNRVHPTQKPVSLVEWIYRRFKLNSKTIADFFGGSGVTLISAEKNNKISYTMEFDASFCDVIVKRYIKFCIENNRPYTIKLNGEDYNGKLLEV